MTNSLMIYLPSQAGAQPLWTDGVVLHEGDIASLANLAAAQDVVVIVPAESVLLTQVTLPLLSRSRLLQALPFALEESVIDDIETLHFAAGEQQPDGNVPVAIVSRASMQTWLDQLKEWKIRPATIMSAIFALPVDVSRVFCLPGDHLIGRVGAYQGYCCERANLSAYLNPLHVTMSTAHEEAFDLRKLSVHSPAINLLQPPYAMKQSTLPSMKVGIRISAILLAIWVGVLFLYPLVSTMMLHHRLTDLNSQIAKIYYQQFPEATSLVAPKLRLQEKLNTLASDMGKHRLLLLVGLVGKGMANRSGIQIKQMVFQQHQLTLELTASTPEELSDLTDYLVQQGLTAKQQNAVMSGTRVAATLQVE